MLKLGTALPALPQGHQCSSSAFLPDLFLCFVTCTQAHTQPREAGPMSFQLSQPSLQRHN